MHLFIHATTVHRRPELHVKIELVLGQYLGRRKPGQYRGRRGVGSARRTKYEIRGAGPGAGEGNDEQAGDAHSLYDRLEHVILPMFYGDQDRYIDVMRHAIALNGSFFNTERMVDQYVRKAYLR